MFDVSRFFGKGDRNTLLMKNGLNLSYNGPYSVVEEGLILDQWHVNTFATAEYTISVDYDTNNKEVLKVLVSASPNQSSLSIYGRSNLGNKLIKIFCYTECFSWRLTSNRIINMDIAQWQ